MIRYSKIEWTGKLRNGNKIHQTISDPRGISVAEAITRDAAMEKACRSVYAKMTPMNSILR